MDKKQPLGLELVRRGVVSGEDIEKALKYQETHRTRKLGDILYILKVVDNDELIKTVGDILGQKGVILNYDSIPASVLEYIPLDAMKKNLAVPFEIDNGKIKVAFADVKNNNENIKGIQMLMLNRGLILEPYIAFKANVEEIFERIEEKSSKKKDKIEENDTATEIVDNLIKLAMEKRASDIHIEPQIDGLRVRFRIDGELFIITKLPKERQPQIIGRIKAISNMHQEKQDSQDGRIVLYSDYDIRVSSQRNIYGEKFVLRLLKKNTNIRNIFELGYPYGEKELDKSINKRNCLSIVAAPTGAGKTTTLYSILDYLKRDDINITTIEDPVEIRIPGLNQIEIEKNISFSDSLRTILRQDPDIILVGEVRDQETAEIAIQAGQTGHYVLSTIHTINAIEVITRLRKMGISDYDIASTLATTTSQRLVRRLCENCKQERDFTDKEKEIINNYGTKYGVNFDLSKAKTYNAVGCEKCNHSGYFDRIGIFEVLDITEDIRELIMNGASSIEVRKKAEEGTYKPLVVDGIQKVVDGITNLDEINRELLIYNEN